MLWSRWLKWKTSVVWNCLSKFSGGCLSRCGQGRVKLNKRKKVISRKEMTWEELEGGLLWWHLPEGCWSSHLLCSPMQEQWKVFGAISLYLECKLVQPLWRTVWRSLKKLEIELPYDPAVPLLGIYTKETRTERDNVYPNVHCSTVYNT